MHRLLIATTLGLALLSAGGLSGSASAHSRDDATHSRSALVQPVHYERYERRSDNYWHRAAERHHEWHRRWHREWQRGYGYDRW